MVAKCVSHPSDNFLTFVSDNDRSDREIRNSSDSRSRRHSTVLGVEDNTMSAREFLMNVTVILTVMAIGALLETAVPMFAAARDRRGRTANLGLTVLSMFSNWLLASVAAVAALTLRPAGLMARVDWPLPVQIVIGMLMLDFSVGYLSHRAMHMLPFMWRFHRIHHSDPFVDVTTTYRTHPVETVWRFLFAVIPIWILGIPALAVVLQRLVQVTNGILEHANVRLWPPLDRVLSLVWVTPNVHKIHHSREISETNSNYGNVLAIYDRLFGTFTPSQKAASVVYGLDDADPDRASSFQGLIAMPLHEPQPIRRAPYTKVRMDSTAAR
jgi:sterol desaturase/sphingolipid hydroxylase (fatty acid hydroxylase superfamily)